MASTQSDCNLILLSFSSNSAQDHLVSKCAVDFISITQLTLHIYSHVLLVTCSCCHIKGLTLRGCQDDVRRPIAAQKCWILVKAKAGFGKSGSDNAHPHRNYDRIHPGTYLVGDDTGPIFLAKPLKVALEHIKEKSRLVGCSSAAVPPSRVRVLLVLTSQTLILCC